MAKSAGYVSADYLRKVAELGRQVKQRSYDLMAIRSGDYVLDVGCGPGIDTVELGRMVGPSGRVLGIDIDEEMLAQADAAVREAQLEAVVEHRQADVKALPLAEGTFDACHAERLFQVLPANYEPNAVFAEMLRVVKSGGRVVVADTDWATASVDFSDAALERRLMAFFASHMRPNGFAGRQLYRLCQEHGLRDVNMEVFPLIQTDFTQSPFGNWLVREALNVVVATRSELDAWTSELQARHDNGCFYLSVNLVLVCGVK